MQSLRFGCTGAAAALALAAAATVTAQDPRINEIRIDQPSTDNDEYFELAGTPGSLSGLWYIVIGDSAVGGSGVVETAINLLGQSIPASGFFLVVENTWTLPGTPNLVLPPNSLNFENNDNVTHMLVDGFIGAIDDDLDTNDDGTLDILPWTSIIDCVAVVGAGTPGVDADYTYCATQIGPNGEFVPGQVYRCDDALTWTIGAFTPGVTDTPGAINTSCDFVPPCGVDLAGDCFEANGTPNCDDETCCNLIIGVYDPTCATEWDQACADLAQVNCRTCGDPDAGSCFEPNGTAYCDNATCCDLVCQIDPTCCQANGWDQMCADLAAANCPQTAVEKDDVVIGLSQPDAATTLQLLRGDAIENDGAAVTDAWNQPYMQSMEFDNLGGVSHNAQGNLLGVNFGTTVTGGSIYSLPACEAFGPGQLIGDTTGTGGAGISQSRLTGLSVSPDNTKIAVVGYDSGRVIVYDYTAGDCHGAGASLSGARETATQPMCLADTQGTAWLDNNTVIAFSSVGAIVGVDATTMATSNLAALATTCGPAFTDIEYNPLISPYVYAMNGEFSGGTTNTLWILDPNAAWGVVNQVDYSTSINTTREIAFDSAGNLWVSQFSDGASPNNIDFIPDAAANAATLLDNDSLDWIDVGSASFPGLDVAATGGGAPPCPWDCQLEPDGQVSVADFLVMLAQWGQAGTSCDFADPPGVNVQDFLEMLANWGPCP
jgi:hypothetical protein